MLEKTGVIYCATFANGKSYIGQALNLKARISAHKHRFKTKKYDHLPIYRAWNRYGQPEFTVLATVSIEYIDRAEEAWIQMFNSRSRRCGYNLIGGVGTKGRVMSKETRSKIGTANAKARAAGGGRYTPTDEHRAKSAVLARKLHTPEVARKISESRKGKCFLTKEQNLLKVANVWRPVRRSDGLVAYSVKNMADITETISSCIMRVISGEFKQHKGFTFQYVEDPIEIRQIKEQAIAAIKRQFNPENIDP